MVPADSANFFAVMAGVGATLFGLIFLVISINPEDQSIIRQVRIASSYGSLLNPLVISLIALEPHATIGIVTLIMSAIGLVNTIIMGVSLLRDSLSWAKKLTSALFITSSLVIFGFELFYAIRLSVAPGDFSALNTLTTILVLIYIYGIARAWELVGARQFHIREALAPLVPQRVGEIISNTVPTETMKDSSKQRD